jgi:hypothetical protein
VVSLESWFNNYKYKICHFLNVIKEKSQNSDSIRGIIQYGPSITQQFLGDRIIFITSGLILVDGSGLTAYKFDRGHPVV